MVSSAAHSSAASPRRVSRSGLVATCLGLTALASGGCNNAGEGAISGAGLGALGGLAIGSFFGAAGTGAAIGAVGGALGGAVIGDQNERNQNRANQDW